MIERVLVTDTPELTSMLDNERNLADGIDLSKITINSSKKLNWKCVNGHYFKEKVSTIYRRKHKCFFCTGRQIWPGENDLQTLFPKLAEEFDITKNGITPDRVSPKDTRSYWWTCQEGHPSFWQSVSHRVERKTQCPYCTGRKSVRDVNDLATLYPEIATEWDEEKNDGLLPTDVSPFTYKSYWWICPKGHSYKKKVIDRTKFHKPVDCPKCVKTHSTSFPEQAIYYYAKKCFPNAINRYKEPFEKGMELDIYIPNLKIGIEYDGYAFHSSKDQHEREYRKYLACKKLGIKLIRIKETKDTWMDTADEILFVKKKMGDEELAGNLYNIFSHIFMFCKRTFKANNPRDAYLNRYFGFPTDFNVKRDRPEIMEYLVDVEHSFGVQHPEQAALWDKEANGKLTPFMLPSGSNYEATWKCPRCENIWQSPVVSIVSRKVKCCKACSMKENGKTLTKVRAAKGGSLAERSEKLLNQWDCDVNGDLSPYEIPLNYSFKVGWKCDKCGYQWSSSPNSRTRGGNISDCPHCTGRVAMPGIDDLETLYPELAKEWDYEKNGDKLPSSIKPYSNKKYYWRCPECGNSYAAYPGNRIKGSGCPMCARAKISKKKSKAIGQFDDNGKLIKTFQNARLAAEAMHVVPNAIHQAVSRGRKSKGYYWRHI